MSQNEARGSDLGFMSYTQHWGLALSINPQGDRLLDALQSLFPDDPPWHLYLFMACARGISVWWVIGVLGKRLKEFAEKMEEDPTYHRFSANMWDGFWNFSSEPPTIPEDKLDDKDEHEKFLQQIETFASKLPEEEYRRYSNSTLTYEQFICLEKMIRATSIGCAVKQWNASIESVARIYQTMVKDIQEALKQNQDVGSVIMAGTIAIYAYGENDLVNNYFKETLQKLPENLEAIKKDFENDERVQQRLNELSTLYNDFARTQREKKQLRKPRTSPNRV